MRLGRLAGLVVAALLSVGMVRQVTAGAAGMETSERALSSGDTRTAIEGARVAAESLLPFSPYPRRGLERLAQIGREAEARGDTATAALAWRTMRTALSETRALGGANAAWLAEADAGLARAAAVDPSAPPGAASEPPASSIGPSPIELVAVAAVPFALYAAATRLLRRKKPNASNA